MVALVKLLGIVIIVLGVHCLLNPSKMKSYVDFWKKGKRIYMGACLSLLIGVIFLFAAPQCRVSWFVTIFGILGLIKGVVIFVLSREKTISMLNWWAEKQVKFLRVHASFALIIGTLLILSA